MYYKDKRYFNIPHFDNYLISADGVVINKGTLKPLKVDFMKSRGFVTNVKIENSKKMRVSINELHATMYYGITNLPIMEKVKIGRDDIEYIDHRNIYYDNQVLMDIDYLSISKFILEDLEYRVIPDTNNMVFVNEDGAVYDFKNQRFRPRSYGIENPYPRMSIFNKSYDIHRLIAMVFLDDFRPELYVNHKDGKMYNSYLSNLEMVTPQENIIHASKLDLINGRAYSADEMHTFCQLLEKKKTIKEIKKEMNLSNQSNDSISRLIYRVTVAGQWKEVSSLYDLSGYDKTINRSSKGRVEKIHKVCQLLQDTDMTNKEISKKTGVKSDSIQAIRAGKQWNDIRDQYDITYTQRKSDFPKERFHEIGKLMEEGYSNSEIMRELDYSSGERIAMFRNGELYTDISSQYDIPPTMRREYLDESDVRLICEKILLGYADIDIHREFFPDKHNRFTQSISDVRKGSNFKDITSEYGLPSDEFNSSPNPRYYITPELKEEAIKIIKENPKLSNNELSTMVRGVPWYMIRYYRSELNCAV